MSRFFRCFEKAVKLISSLTYFKLDTSFIKWMEVFYTGASTCVCNNGYSSGFFDVQRGVRQGCPLSPYMFILAAEILAIKVVNNDNIKGISIFNNDVKLLQYADDTSFFIDGTAESLNTTLHVLDKLKKASGLTINISKSSLFPLGPYVTCTPAFVHDLDIIFTHGPVTVLGITFTTNREDLHRLNYAPKLSRLKAILKGWSFRDITPIGRNVIVKTFALSQLVFLFLVLPSPPSFFIKEIESAIFDFIWSGNPDKIKRSVITNPVNEGGLKVTHVQSFINSLKCTWVKRYCAISEGPWKIFWDISLSAVGKHFFSNVIVQKMMLILTMFF